MTCGTERATDVSMQYVSVVTRLVIAGVPKAGKTTLAGVLYQYEQPTPAMYHTDDLIRPGAWSGVSAEVATWFASSGPWIVEGVAAVRALRKWLVAHSEGTPCDRVIWLDTPRVELTPGQLTMAKGCRTVWREVRPRLLARGVHVEEV